MRKNRKNLVKALVLLCLLVLLVWCLFYLIPSFEKKTPTETGQNGQTETVSETEHEADSNATEEENEAYKKLMTDGFKNFNGTLSYSLHVYDSGSASLNDSAPMKSASVIKLFIMEYAYSLMESGELKSDAVISGRSLSSLLESMITVSDNTATNILIDYFTMEKVNAFIQSQGYTETKLQRRMLDTAAASRGEENYTSARDVMKFLDKLYAKKDSYPYRDMLVIMKRQQVSTKLRRNMPAGVEMASKTGELSDTENDVAIVFTPEGDYAICCLTGGGSASAARDAMANLCKRIYDTLQKGA